MNTSQNVSQLNQESVEVRLMRELSLECRKGRLSRQLEHSSIQLTFDTYCQI
jgi:hypothetical protein